MPKSDALKNVPKFSTFSTLFTNFICCKTNSRCQLVGNKFGTSWHICMQLTLVARWDGRSFYFFTLPMDRFSSSTKSIVKRDNFAFTVHISSVLSIGIHPVYFAHTAHTKTEIIDIFYGPNWQSTCQRSQKWKYDHIIQYQLQYDYCLISFAWIQ